MFAIFLAIVVFGALFLFTMGKLAISKLHAFEQAFKTARDLMEEARRHSDATLEARDSMHQRQVKILEAKLSESEMERTVAVAWSKSQAASHIDRVDQLESALDNSRTLITHLSSLLERFEQKSFKPATISTHHETIDLEIRARVTKIEADISRKAEQASIESTQHAACADDTARIEASHTSTLRRVEDLEMDRARHTHQLQLELDAIRAELRSVTLKQEEADQSAAAHEEEVGNLRIMLQNACIDKQNAEQAAVKEAAAREQADAKVREVAKDHMALQAKFEASSEALKKSAADLVLTKSKLKVLTKASNREIASIRQEVTRLGAEDTQLRTTLDTSRKEMLQLKQHVTSFDEQLKETQFRLAMAELCGSFSACAITLPKTSPSSPTTPTPDSFTRKPSNPELLSANADTEAIKIVRQNQSGEVAAVKLPPTNTVVTKIVRPSQSDKTIVLNTTPGDTETTKIASHDQAGEVSANKLPLVTTEVIKTVRPSQSVKTAAVKTSPGDTETTKIASHDQAGEVSAVTLPPTTTVVTKIVRPDQSDKTAVLRTIPEAIKIVRRTPSGEAAGMELANPTVGHGGEVSITTPPVPVLDTPMGNANVFDPEVNGQHWGSGLVPSCGAPHREDTEMQDVPSAGVAVVPATQAEAEEDVSMDLDDSQISLDTPMGEVDGAPPSIFGMPPVSRSQVTFQPQVDFSFGQQGRRLPQSPNLFAQTAPPRVAFGFASPFTQAVARDAPNSLSPFVQATPIPTSFTSFTSPNPAVQASALSIPLVSPNSLDQTSFASLSPFNQAVASDIPSGPLTPVIHTAPPASEANLDEPMLGTATEVEVSPVQQMEADFRFSHEDLAILIRRLVEDEGNEDRNGLLTDSGLNEPAQLQQLLSDWRQRGNSLATHLKRHSRPADGSNEIICRPSMTAPKSHAEALDFLTDFAAACLVRSVDTAVRRGKRQSVKANKEECDEKVRRFMQNVGAYFNQKLHAYSEDSGASSAPEAAARPVVAPGKYSDEYVEKLLDFIAYTRVIVYALRDSKLGNWKEISNLSTALTLDHRPTQRELVKLALGKDLNIASFTISDVRSMVRKWFSHYLEPEFRKIGDPDTVQSVRTRFQDDVKLWLEDFPGEPKEDQTKDDKKGDGGDNGEGGSKATHSPEKSQGSSSDGKSTQQGHLASSLGFVTATATDSTPGSMEPVQQPLPSNFNTLTSSSQQHFLFRPPGAVASHASPTTPGGASPSGANTISTSTERGGEEDSSLGEQPDTMSDTPVTHRPLAKKPRGKMSQFSAAELEKLKSEAGQAPKLTHYSSRYLECLRDHMSSDEILVSLDDNADEADRWIELLRSDDAHLEEAELVGLSDEMRDAESPYNRHGLLLIIETFCELFVWAAMKELYEDPDDLDTETVRERYMEAVEVYLAKNAPDSWNARALETKAQMERE